MSGGFQVTTKDKLKRAAEELQEILDEWRGKTMPGHVVEVFDAKAREAEELCAQWELERGKW